MKDWWQGLNKREQTMVASLSLVVVIFVFFSFVWQPINDNLAKQKNNIVNKQELLTWVQQNTAKFQGVNRSTTSPKTSASLTSVVNSTARQWNIAVARMQPKDDSLQVWIDEVPFNDFLAWTEHLYLKQGVVINGVDIAAANDPGMVRINRLELGL